ncbi:MAG: HAMP domain-containing protein [Pyrinomonadaceae bacterium]|nr:HAMP domain-containing protein [Pyrinomonadaceae bacterium]
MREPKQRRRTAPWLLGTLVLSLLSLLVALQVFGLYQIVPTETASDTLLLYALSSLNFIAFIVFAFIFVRSLLKLRRERRERRLGSKIKTRLVVYFISLSLLPITAMAVFSFLFLNRSLERWFGKLPEEVMAEARQLQEDVVKHQAQSLRDSATMIALMLREKPELETERVLAGLIERGNLAAIEIITPDGQVLVRSTARLSPSEIKELEQALEAARASGGESRELTDGRGYDVVIVPINDSRQLIVAPARYSDSNKAILASKPEYEKLKARQRKVRQLGLSTLGLFTLLQLFGVTWIAIHLGRGFAAPIQALAEASNEVASGNLSYRVTTFADDELALLVARFNQMTAQLEENRRRLESNAAELREKNLAIEERRNYIETVLESLSTGVVSFDSEDCVTTINAAAAAMLRLSEMPSPGARLSEITSTEDRLILERLLKRARRMGQASEQTELARGSLHEGVSIPVALTATALHSSNGAGTGVVLVIEDLSELLAAQRTAAWSEVARRMAHEIKNPLTPIQLSAERIAKNFKRASNGKENGDGANGNGSSLESSVEERERVHRVVEECTATITREVAGLKAMVDEFSRFARLPHARLEASDLNEVVRQAVTLYEDRLADIRMDVRLARTLPPAMLDQEQMRRVLVNLIDNALEAVAVVEGERRITIATAHDPARGQLLVEVTDTGHGIPREDFPRLFQPYFSTRERGTGLGLAIVQRIMNEHNGRIRAEQNRPRGAKFIIELPTTGS